MKIYDISIPIKNGMINYPNNPDISIENYSSMNFGASSNLTKIILGSHTGTHIDAPLHTIIEGDSITDISLESFIGNCFVYDLSNLKPEENIKINDLEDIHVPQKDEIIIVKTSNSIRGYDNFYSDFVYLDGDTADYLAEIGIKLFGIDYLSVKKRGSSDNRAHNSLLSKKIPIVEGLNLKDITNSGQFQFIALPLKIEGCDGSPTRAILIEN